MAAIGRPRKQPPPDCAERILKLAAEGGSQRDIAAALTTQPDILRRWMMEDDILALAFAMGRERERHELHQMILRDARDGERPNVNAMFLLKCRHQYREGEAVDSGVPRISITFNLPGAMTRDDFMKQVVSDDNGT